MVIIKIQDDNKTWGKFGSVYSYKKKHYIRLGSTQSYYVIKNELVRNKKWMLAVKYMAKTDSTFGKKLKSLL